MRRRWPVTVTLGLATLALLAAAYVNGIGDAMPFSSAYHSAYQGLVTLGGFCALAGVWAVTRWLDRRWIASCLGITLCVALATITVYERYHRQHGPLLVPDGFRGHLERVTPFHEQLAVPVFITLGFAVVALALALRPSRTRGHRRAAPASRRVRSPQNVMTTDDAE